MITALAAVLVSSGSTLPAMELATSELPALFVSACLDGEAKLSAADANAVGFDDLPRELQRQFPTPSSSQIWRLHTHSRAFLYILSYEPGPTTRSQMCGVASDEMDYSAAAAAVEKRVMGNSYPETGKSMQWADPQNGNIVTATTAGEFKVLQTDLLSGPQRAALTKKYRRVLP